MRNYQSCSSMIFEYLKLNINLSDDEFNAIYPEWIRNLARRHWTPLSVIKQTVNYLVPTPGTRVLDIGSGPGKFCMVGATCSKGYFTGVEQRKNLVDVSNKLSRSYRIKNVDFIHSNITSIKFSDFDAFYFFNPFQENIDQSAKIDSSVDVSKELYEKYNEYICGQFAIAPVGTRIVTYWSSMKEIPTNYQLKHSFFGGMLKYWEKID